MKNERIQKLAEQANCSIDGMGYGEGNIEKFAELIVRECLQLCINVHNDPDRPFSVPGSLHCIEDIQQHFGVEE